MCENRCPDACFVKKLIILVFIENKRQFEKKENKQGQSSNVILLENILFTVIAIIIFNLNF